MTRFLQRFKRAQWRFLTLLLVGLSAETLTAQNGPACDTYTNKTTANGLASSFVNGVYAVGTTVYAATNGGLSISTDGGTTFTNRLVNNVIGVYAVGTTVYAATYGGGLSISTNSGNTFTNKTTANGLGDNRVWGVYAVGTTVYAATAGGLSISTDGGATFTNRTTANGLGNNFINGVYAVGTTVYAATNGGISISTNSGITFTNRSTVNGLGNNGVYGAYAVGTTVYAATLGGGLSISTDGGTTFTNRTTANGLGNNSVYGVYTIGTTVYAAILGGGLSISTDGGTTFTTRTTANGLGSNVVLNVYAVGTMVYAATTSGLSFCTATLPVNLISFTATPQPSNRVSLAWATAMETGNRGFLVERSKDMHVFEPVAEVGERAPNSSVRQDYQLIDQTPYRGTSYYRLTQIDLSGKRTVYRAVSVVLRDEAYGVYPNPVVTGGRFTLRLDEPETATVSLYSADGRYLPLQKAGVASGNLVLKTMGKLSTGVYVLHVEERGQIRKHRIIID